MIWAQELTESAKFNVVRIHRIDLAPSETGLLLVLRRRQFPVATSCCHYANHPCTKFTCKYIF